MHLDLFYGERIDQRNMTTLSNLSFLVPMLIHSFRQNVLPNSLLKQYTVLQANQRIWASVASIQGLLSLFPWI